MSLFAIYLCKADGVAATFETYEAVSDEHALSLAELVLQQHRTTSFGDVWLEDRLVGRVDRSACSRKP